MSAQLHAIGPLDGRYRGRLDTVSAHFSEYAYIKHRVEVEIEYFIALLKMSPPLPQLVALSPPSAALVTKLQAVS
jgi:adenylosuccinate lyase